MKNKEAALFKVFAYEEQDHRLSISDRRNQHSACVELWFFE